MILPTNFRRRTLGGMTEIPCRPRARASIWPGCAVAPPPNPGALTPGLSKDRDTVLVGVTADLAGELVSAAGRPGPYRAKELVVQ
jgi:hypothetical protein